MNKFLHVLIALATLSTLLTACKEDDSYAEQKERERNLITSFVNRTPILLQTKAGDTLAYIPKIEAISQEQFEDQDSMTYGNQYVVFNKTGIYMQILTKGTGEKIKSGESKRVMCRYWEYNIQADSLRTSNLGTYWMTSPDILDVSNSYGTITASFNTSINGGGAMYRVYKTTAVPTGWVVPLSYINLGRYTSSEEGIARVRLIVPHSSGQTDASNNVYPCFYEISYEAMRD